MSAIATVQRLAVTTVTPLHIGAGGSDMLDDLDYVSAERVYVIDHERMLAGLSSERLRLAEQAAPLRQLLGPEERQRYARYSLPNPTGQGRVPRMLGQVKDVFGRPYLPGSSLKGAIRTALAWALLRARDQPIGRGDLGYNPRFADDPLMSGLLGRNPYYDLLRTMQVADSAPAAPEQSLDLLQVALYSLRRDRLTPKGEGWAFFVEALRPGVELRLSLRLDDFLLAPEQARQVELEGYETGLRGWLGHCQAFSAKVIAYEQSFYADYGPPALAAFYDDLAVQAEGLEAGREALLQLAWGAGWLSKTVGTALTADELAMVRSQFRLGRNGVDEFPKSRRLVERGGGPSAPLGWVRLRLL
ncbi:MAG: type III-A CRISPR-associated RAMP protein Csm5 [Oscillochloridaceae bacterium umkhey_bin13]